MSDIDSVDISFRGLSTFETAQDSAIGLIEGIDPKPINEVRPYWRNPRKISDEAVRAVQDSIVEFGYRQPIVIDPEGTIITGHTRYAALRGLGATQVSVLVADLSPIKAREYRIMDNKTSEFSEWDMDALTLELREFEKSLVNGYFPEINLDIDELERLSNISTEDIEKAVERVENPKSNQDTTATVTCPHCFESFEIGV